MFWLLFSFLFFCRVVTMAEARKRKCYDFKFKQAVIKHAEETNNRKATRKYAVDESMVRRWRKIIASDSSAALTKRKRNFGGGTRPVLENLEEDLLVRIIDERERHFHVPCKLITTWALFLFLVCCLYFLSLTNRPPILKLKNQISKCGLYL